MKTSAFTFVVLSTAACGSDPAGGGERFMDSGTAEDAGPLGSDSSAIDSGGAERFTDSGTAEDAGPSRPDSSAIDSGLECFPCEGRWICGGDVTYVDLKPEMDGCYLSGLPGRNLLALDGTVTRDGAVIGKAAGTGARVSVALLDGTLWLYCAAGGGCRR